MLTLKTNGLYAKFLKPFSGHHLPNTVCDLLTYTVVAVIAYCMLCIIVVSVISGGVIAWQNGFSVDRIAEKYSESAAYIIITTTVIWHCYALLHVFNWMFGRKIAAWQEKRRQKYIAEYNIMTDKLWNNKITSSEFDAWFESSNYNKSSWFNTTKTFLGAIWKRFSEKACVMIDWK